MRIKNLVASFIEYAKRGETKGRYYHTFPALFDHYFLFWADKNLPFYDDVKTIQKQTDLILGHLSSIENRFKKHGLDTEALRVVLFVGKNTTNGHAALLDEEWWVWLPVEAYASEFQVNTFVTHEILHGLHYQRHPKLFFRTRKQKYLLSRQVITEGLATFGSMTVLGVDRQQALWADYLSDMEYITWWKEYKNQRRKIANYILQNWNTDSKGLFEANNPKDIFNFRAGYAFALEVIEAFSKKTKNFDDLFEMSPSLIESWIRKHYNSTS